MNTFLQFVLGLFIQPAISRYEASHAKATNTVTTALAAIDAAAALALTHDQKTQSQVQALTQTIATVTDTNAVVQQKSATLQTIGSAIAQAIGQ